LEINTLQYSYNSAIKSVYYNMIKRAYVSDEVEKKYVYHL